MYKVQAPLDEVGAKLLAGEKMEFINHSSGEKLMSPSSVQFVDANGTDAVMFTSEGQQIGDNSSIRLYVAPYQNENQLEASPSAQPSMSHITLFN